MGFKRRSLLQASALSLAGWALSGSDWTPLGQRYKNVLAAPAPRKYALLVGLNQYGGDDVDCPDLRGCLNDLELQRQLLIHRYGFEPGDILLLKDKAASRSRVQAAFISHLLEQAGPDDTVLFHFSGYGSRIRTSESDAPQRSLVLYDSCSKKAGPLRDWPERSLMALLGALPGDRVIAVLDTGYDTPLPGASGETLRQRSRPSPPPAAFDAAGLALAESLQQTLGDRPGNGNAPIILRAVQAREAAVEFESQAGPVGLLTYSLCQQLWQSGANSTWGSTLEGTTARFQQTLGTSQRPKLVNARLQGQALDKVGLRPRTAQGCAGAITQIKPDGSLQVWLGGLCTEALAHCGEGALIRVDVPSSEDSPEFPQASFPRYFVLQDRHGWVAQGRPWTAAGSSDPTVSPKAPTRSPLHISQPFQEQVRIIPRNFGLNVGLDSRLDRIERVDATSALTSVPSISVVATKDAPTDYIFGRISTPSAVLVASLPQAAPATDGTSLKSSSSQPPEQSPILPQTQYGLLTLNQQALPATVGASAEAIKSAIQRLQPYLETLRAEKILQILENTHSSGLALAVRWETLRAAKGGKPEEIAVRVAQGSQGNAAPVPMTPIAGGDRLRYTVKNEGSHPLYILLLGVNSLGQWLMPFRPEKLNPEKFNADKLSSTSNRLALTGKTLNEPISPGNSLKGEWPVESQQGVTTLYLVAITAPFNQAYGLLSAQKQDLVEALSLQRLRDPSALAKALLGDLQAASRNATPRPAASEDHYALNTDTWATFRYAYEVL